MLRRTGVLIVFATGLFAANVSSDEYLGIIKFLASPEMKGRATGSPELEKAASYIRDQFRSAKLKPVSGDSYYQDFDVTTSARLGKKNELTYSAGTDPATLRFEQDFIPLNLSAAGEVSGNVVFAGFGITAPEYNYDDYSGLDVKGKIVLLLRHEPQEFDEKSVFEGKVYTAHSQMFSKAANAKFHGAKAVLLVNDVGTHSGDPDDLEKFGATAGPDNAGLEFVQVKANVVNKWLALSGKNLEAIESGIDKDLHPESFALPEKLQSGPDRRYRPGSENSAQCRLPTFPGKPANTSLSARITIIWAWVGSSPWRPRSQAPSIPAPTTMRPAPRA